MNRQMEVPVMWDKRQARKESGLSGFTIDQLVKSGKIKFIRLGVGKRGKILINAASLCEYMRGGDKRD